MFVFLATILLIATMRFGGVETHVWLSLSFAFVLFFALTAWKHLRTDPRALIAAAAAIALAAFVDPKLALGPMAGVAAWMAVRKLPTSLPTFLSLLLAIGVFEALLGLYQYFIVPGWIFGYMNANLNASGTLINRNHFAGLLGMLIPVALGLAYLAWTRYKDPARAYIYLLAASIMGLALTFSLSRMGILSLAATLALLAFLLSAHSLRLGTAFLLIPGVLLVGGALWTGIDVIVDRYDRLIDQDGAIQEARLGVFRDTIALIADNPMGVGPGAYQDAFRRYQTEHNELVFTHAHNDYLETAAEWGLPIAAAFWLGVLFVVGTTARQLTRTNDTGKRGVLLAALGGIFYILIHSLTDFNLQIPSNAMIFFTFLGIAIALPGAGSIYPAEQVVRRGSAR